MSNNTYSRDFTKGSIAHQEGDLLVIDGPAHLDGDILVFDEENFLPHDVDYSDSDSVKMLATSAIHTADGFNDLVTGNCDVYNPETSQGTHIEMYLALSSLACEIYMKAIIYQENLHNGNQVKGHGLDDLFGELPNEIQGTIKSKVSNIEEILPAIGDMFTKLRYNFEQNHIHGEYLVVFKLMEELRAIAHTYPQKKPGTIQFTNGMVVFE